MNGLFGIPISHWLPIASSLIIGVFAATVFRRFLRRPSWHLAFWSIGLTMYGLGVLCEALYAVVGWNGLLFRLWYLLGAILVAAWLGQGTVYLLAPRRAAHILALLLVAGNVLIALGALAPGLGGLFSRLGLRGYLYLGELLGAVLMYAGFLRSVADTQRQAQRSSSVARVDALTVTGPGSPVN